MDLLDIHKFLFRCTDAVRNVEFVQIPNIVCNAMGSCTCMKTSAWKVVTDCSNSTPLQEIHLILLTKFVFSSVLQASIVLLVSPKLESMNACHAKTIVGLVNPKPNACHVHLLSFITALDFPV